MSSTPIIRRFIASVQATRYTGADREEHLDDVWAMVQKTYASIGVKVSSPNEILSKYDVWDLNIQEGRPIAFSLSHRTKFGFKVGLLGSDGSLEGKTVAVRNLRNNYNRDGYYTEVSHKVKDIVLASGAPVVCATYVSEVLGKPIEPVDEISYRRNISGVGFVTKVMVGSPRGIPTTSAQDPTCPIRPRVARQPNLHPADIEDVVDLHAHFTCLMS